MKLIKKISAFRDYLLRWMGIMPRNDFILYADDVFKVLHAMENFTKQVSIFSNEVSKKLGIQWERGKIIEFEGKTEKDVENEYRERGMI